ncbi:MAG: hypothetical protein KDA78_00900 [Planctomycetaceae bacterium]|nr:hypothetical protein [Planctomycetaceae bacterium]
MDYSLKPLSKNCSATGQPLEPGDLCYSVLIEKNGRHERLDFSSSAWKGVPEGALGVWRTEVPAAEIKPVNPFDNQRLLDQFIEFTEQCNDSQKKLRYVLALLLVRKKQLVHEQNFEQDGEQWMQLRGVRGEGLFKIPEEKLTQHEMTRLQAEIDQWTQAPALKRAA